MKTDKVVARIPTGALRAASRSGFVPLSSAFFAKRVGEEVVVVAIPVPI